MTLFTRAFPLEDISIRSGGDGRTVEAYAAVFNAPAEIMDQDGHYLEQISPAAFTKTLADNGLRFGVFYNHGKTLSGTPSDRGSMPLGTPLEVKADAKGLLTVTRYNKTPLADEVLESIRNGDIRGQSFSGRFVDSAPKTPRWGFKADASGSLPLVTRNSIAMREYGPTPFPAYGAAEIVGVRAVFASLSDEERRELALMLRSATPVEEPAEHDTPPGAVAPDEPVTEGDHSARHSIERLRWQARQKGIVQ